MEKTKKQKRNAYEHAYKQEHYKRIIALIPRDENQELLEFLETKKSVSNYIYELIKKDFETQKQND